jgi:hypothetical protein
MTCLSIINICTICNCIHVKHMPYMRDINLKENKQNTRIDSMCELMGHGEYVSSMVIHVDFFSVEHYGVNR